MKYPLIFFSCLALLSIGCQQAPLETTKKSDKYLDKFYPQNLRDLERAFPDKEVNVKAYKRGKLEVQDDIERQALRRDGFDLPWTIQGPSNLGARINCIAQDSEDDDILYAGFAGGGLWRTKDGGRNWFPIFDDEVYNSIGEITLDPANPGTVYIGTGDPNVPGRAYIGSGLYKSTDYGDSWTHLGLEEQKVISKIKIHPDDPNTLYVGSMGQPFVADDTRGIYKSTDGGTNWEKIFFAGDTTGISDFIINPENPELMYVATWDRIRNSRFSLISGEGSGIYVSEDSGASWDKAVGIPDTMMSRTGLAICEGAPNNVYAVTVATDSDVGGVYRSTDYGMTFDALPVDSLFFDYFGEMRSAYFGFGWYFGKLTVDPNDPDHIYLLGVDLWETYNAGEDWDLATTPWFWYEVHADKHELLIDEDGGMLLATDGGMYRGIVGDMYSWQDMENIPTTQFYRVGYNPHEPDLYYGGAQDNGTTAGNIDNINEWPRLIGGDGFQTIFDPEDPDHWFGEVQRGSIRMTRDGGNRFENITEEFDGNSNWDTPYFLSPHDRNVLYMGRDTIYKSESSYRPEWEIISPDLTDGGFATDLNPNISALDESPLIEGRLYAGTSNGLVKVLAGGTWMDVTDGLPSRYVSSIKASPTHENYVYVTLSGYTENDFVSRVYRSENIGFGWTEIGQNLPDIAVNDIYILPGYDDRILFVATDGGVYGSLNYGDDWTRLGNNMPNIVCYDLEYNIANEELVVATFGRSIMTYPLQDFLGPVSTAEVKKQELVLKVYPNPAENYIELEVPASMKKDFTIDILDKIGRKTRSLENNSRVDISELVPGSYSIIVKSDKEIRSALFVKS